MNKILQGFVAPVFACVALVGASAATAQTGGEVQDDWSGGPGAAGPVIEWGSTFDSSSGVSWRTLPGRLSLAGDLLPAPVESIIADNPGGPRQVAVGDFDADGADEVVSSHPVTDLNTGSIFLWKLEADGSWSQRIVSEDFYGADYLTAADVDGDGDLDIAAAAYYGIADPPPPPPETRNGRFAWFENLRGDGSAWEQHLVGELYWGANWIDVGDLDGDGDADLVGGSELASGVFEQDADVVWFENLDGVGDSWLEHSVDDDLPNVSETHLVDLDQDGDLDILAASMASFGFSNHHWFENLGGAAAFELHQIPGSFSGSGYVDVGDLDGDGDLDLLGGGLLGGAVILWENLGRAATWNVQTVATLVHVRVLELRDVEGDGDLDALAATSFGSIDNEAWWIENTAGDGSVWETRLIRELPQGLTWIAGGDTDGDGRLEAAVANEHTLFPREQQLRVYELTEDGPGGELTSSVLDGGTEPDWGVIGWQATGPGAPTVEVRAGDNPEFLGTFIPVPEPGSDLGELIDPAARYLQYRMTLDPGSAPVVDEVAVNTLFLGPLDPGVAGGLNTLEARWHTPGDRISFFVSTQPGHSVAPGCADTDLDLAAARRIGRAVVDASGSAVVQLSLPASFSGRTVYLQAVVRGDCRSSSRVRQVVD